MRKMILFTGLLALLACSKAGDDVIVPPQGGAVITHHDPRDYDQCRVQPALAWCVNARKTGDLQ